MPADFPAWDRGYAFFRRCRDKGLTAEFHDRLRDRVREAAVRAPLRSGGEAGLSGPCAIVRVMTSVKDPEDFVGVTDTIDALLRQCVDHINRNRDMCTLKAEWFAYIGELTLEGEVTWFGMGRGGWYHDGLPTGLSKAPVYAGFYWCREDDKPPVARANIVVVPLADAARIAAADWGDGYNGYEPAPLDGYAVLCSSPFDPKRAGVEGAEAHLRNAKCIIAAGDAEGRQANYAEIITDPDRGGNALFFPVEGEERDGYSAVEPDGTVVCLAFIDYDFD